MLLQQVAHEEAVAYGSCIVGCVLGHKEEPGMNIFYAPVPDDQPQHITGLNPGTGVKRA
jgi:hypothetical protein